jgi:SagB-type dehydrogenase family enzyme
MRRINRLLVCVAVLGLLGRLAAQPIELPPAQKTGGLPLMEALARRATARAFDPAELSRQELSNLLWAAFGINRPDGKRTAPSARDHREAEIYVLLKPGVFRYDAVKHQLDQISTEDARAWGGVQSFVKDAPVTLVYVADLARMSLGTLEEKKPFAYIDAGYISQNVYLYCASAGLATGARAMVDRPALGAKLRLRADQLIVLAQSVGRPAQP